MDLKMPGISGVEATRAITSASPHVAVLVLTMFDEDDSVFSAIQAGGRGYVLKGVGPTEMLRAVHAVAGGEAIFGPSVARRVLELFGSRPTPSATVYPELTARERQVPDLVARAHSNSDIARHLHVSDKTVRNHISNRADGSCRWTCPRTGRPLWSAAPARKSAVRACTNREP
jgi:DNA-binding NarL/FixJ family response regulator